ncbi:hypothetical protein HNR46_001452 [Haloferula luteola]|uniref:Uncharacterized protein n=1 Tax=Haloferula luteola TaxID=595692 RepID=A0A840V928_9BACT|nr:hypothetical protein [Haloferula luteola]MBB5351218.1 hypothetical protein [Haloferula luteola]
MHHLERHAAEWIEIRAGQLKVRKGHFSPSRLQAIRDLMNTVELPSHTGFWITPQRTLHFKPNFPSSLRASLRDQIL